MNTNLAKRLEDLRIKNGLTQRQLAERLDISRQAVSKWERGESEPDTDNLVGLANIYGVSIDEIVGFKNKESSDFASKREEFFGYEKPNDKKEEKSKAYMFPFPVIVVAVFLGIGFGFGVWHPTWLIFMTIPLYYYIVGWVTNGKYGERKNFWELFPYPIIVVIAYFILGVYFNMWHPTWLIFMTIPIYYSIIKILKYKGDDKKVWALFPFPVLVSVIFLIMGFVWGFWHPGWLIFLTIPIWAFFTEKNKKNKGNEESGSSE